MIGGTVCGAPSKEYMRLTEAMANEMPEVHYLARPWQTVCDSGHTVSHNISEPIVDPIPDPNICGVHHSLKVQGKCVKCLKTALTRRPAAPKEIVCEGCDVVFMSVPTKPGARSKYCSDCERKNARFERERGGKYAVRDRMRLRSIGNICRPRSVPEAYA
jgi:hypothetical protein